MKTITMARRPINEAALQQELMAELGAEYIGLSTTPQEIVLFFPDAAASDAISLAQIIVKSHDPLRLTTAQQAELEIKVELAAAAAAAQYPSPLDTSQYHNENALIIELAERLRRLELLQELNNAR